MNYLHPSQAALLWGLRHMQGFNSSSGQTAF